MNWRGLFSFGTNTAGGASTVAVEWPGFRTTAWHSMGEAQEQTKNWMGRLLEGQRDAGGQMYMRNRYYDPATGQFTQTDPIGIAGGLNTYGFAAGDPVTYRDPYGLCPGIPGTNQLDFSDCPPGYFSALGAVAGGTIGGIGGGISGGGGGLTLCAATGPGALVCGGLGATAGAAIGARRGATIGGAIGGFIDGVLFAKQQADAISTAQDQVGEIERHLGLLNGEPNGRGSNHWRAELRAFIGKVEDQIRHMGRRTGAEWQRKVDHWRRELERLTPDEK